MDLTQLLNAGGMAGFAIGIIDVLLDGLLLRWIAPTANEAPVPNQTRYPLLMLLNLLIGVGIGLLFWLSWGFAALVRVCWWERGLLFAAVLWGVCYLPYAMQLYLNHRINAREVIATALQRGYGLCVICLACAWTYAKGY